MQWIEKPFAQTHCIYCIVLAYKVEPRLRLVSHIIALKTFSSIIFSITYKEKIQVILYTLVQK